MYHSAPNWLEQKYSWLVLVTLALVITLFVRLPYFGTLPAGLNRDEAALGYNAYSLLKTGTDEWGNSWPISITSFGDQKLPGYIYTLIPFIALFDLNTFAIRLPSFLAGLVIVAGVGWLTLHIAQKTQVSLLNAHVLSFIAMVFIATAPWALHFSHTAYEAHLATSFFITGLVAYFLARENKVVKHQRILLITTAFLWCLTLLTYHSYHIFLPLFLVSLVLIEKKRLLTFDKAGIFGGLAVGVCTGALLFFGGVIGANQVKNQGITPFSSTHLLNQATEYRSAVVLPPVVKKILFNKVTEGVVTLGENYATAFSGEFLFVHGSNHGDHNPGNRNNLSLLLLPLLPLGIAWLWQHREQPVIQLLGGWIFLGFVPAALTISPLHEVRMVQVWPALEILGGLGVMWLLQWLEKKPRLVGQAAGALLFLLILFSAFRTFVTYTELIPREVMANNRYHLLAQSLAKYERQGFAVITQSPTSSPYIWYLVENKIDPFTFQKSVEHYAPTDEGFIHVKRVGSVYFETIQWDDLSQRATERPLILVFKPTEISPDQTSKDPRFSLLEEIKNEKGEVLYQVWRYGENPEVTQ